MNSVLQKKGIIRPAYFLPKRISESEEFKFIDNTIVNNVIPERYLISNFGRIYDTFSERFISNVYDRKGLKKDGTPKGYPYCSIKYRDNNDIIQSKKIRLNRAVIKSFNPVDNMDNLEVNHKDGNHSNNELSNLEWNTREQNKAHAFENKMYCNGENHCGASITNKQAETVCKLLSEGYSNSEIYNITKIDRELITNIKRRHSYRYVSEKYKW